MIMSNRKYIVAHTYRDGSRKELIAFFVSDAASDDELSVRPKAAVFPISIMFDEATQQKQAKRYAEYLNKLAEAARQAHEQTHLIDILSR